MPMRKKEILRRKTEVETLRFFCAWAIGWKFPRQDCPQGRACLGEGRVGAIYGAGKRGIAHAQEGNFTKKDRSGNTSVFLRMGNRMEVPPPGLPTRPSLLGRRASGSNAYLNLSVLHSCSPIRILNKFRLSF